MTGTEVLERPGAAPTVGGPPANGTTLEGTATAWSWLILPLGILWYLALPVACYVLSASGEPIAAGIPAALLFFGWITGSFEIYDYMDEIQRLPRGTAIVLGWLFALVCLTPLAVVLLPNAHRVAEKHGL